MNTADDSGIAQLSEMARAATTLSVLLDHDENFRGELKAAVEADALEVQNVLLRRIGGERMAESVAATTRSKSTAPPAVPDGTSCFRIWGRRVCITWKITID